MSESRTVGQLLTERREQQLPIAFVVDEYGRTSGLATAEDLFHELMGEMHDEHHVVDARMRRIDAQRVMADGSLPMDELVLEDLDVPPIEGAETVAAYIVATLGRLAKRCDRIRLGRYEALVDEVRRRRAHRVVFRAMSDEELEVDEPHLRSPLPAV